MAVNRLGRADHEPLRMSAKDPGDGVGLDPIVELSSGSVRVDVADLRRVDAGILQRKRHARADPLEIGVREVPGVGVRAVARQLGEHGRVAALGVVERLEDQESRTLADDEALSSPAERAAGALRVVAAGGEHAHGVPGCENDRGQRRVGPAGEHHVGFSGAERAEGLANRVGSRRASDGKCEVRALESQLGGEEACRRIRHGSGDDRRLGARARLGEAVSVRLLARRNAPEARSDVHAAAGTIDLLQARCRERLSGRRVRGTGSRALRCGAPGREARPVRRSWGSPRRWDRRDRGRRAPRAAVFPASLRARARKTTERRFRGPRPDRVP